MYLSEVVSRWIYTDEEGWHWHACEIEHEHAHEDEKDPEREDLDSLGTRRPLVPATKALVGLKLEASAALKHPCKVVSPAFAWVRWLTPPCLRSPNP